MYGVVHEVSEPVCLFTRVFSSLLDTWRVGFLLVLVVGLPLVEGERSLTAHFRHPTRRNPFTLSTSLALVLFVSFLLEAWGFA